MSRTHFWRLCTVTLLVIWVGQALAAGPEPLVYYPFNELGGTIVDASGNGNDGVPNGGIQFVETGYAQGCFSFNGSDSFVELDRPIQDDFTIMAWIKTDTNGAAGSQAYQGTGLFWSDVGGVADDFVIAVLGTKFSFFCGNPDRSVNSDGDIVTGEWVHVAAVRDISAGVNSIYIDGAFDNSTDHSNTGPLDSQAVLAIGANTLDQRFYDGLIDEVKIYDVPLTEDEVQEAMRIGITGEMASDPDPASELVDVPRDVVLGWTVGEFAQTHDVYFGASFDDVNDASRTDPLGVLLSQGQTAAAYDPEGLLDFGQTYYWRVDEVNGAPDYTVFKGEVWSFTAEPFAYPIENIIATSNAIATEPGIEPANTVNGLGLNADDQHSIEASDMWAAPAGGEPVYLQYEFDKVYKLYELTVWNYNVMFELMLGFGFKDVTIEISEDGADWTVLKDVAFAQATAKADYAANTVVDLQGVSAKFVRLTANTGHGPMGTFGLSEVRFSYIPVLAREPQPADGATDISVDVLLDWRAGREAVSHEVVFGTDPEALTLLDTVTDSQYNPGGLDLGVTYHWQITEVNDAEAISAWTGPIWSFATQEYIVIDDFESYTDNDGERVYQAWIDGYGVSNNGSQVGYLESPFAEQTNVYSGAQAMPLFYDNTGGAFSEAELTLPAAQNWARAGIATLVVHVNGALENDAAAVYVKINNTKVANLGPSTTAPVWKVLAIDLAASGASLSSVTTVTVGVEGPGSGVIYVDDVRLYGAAPAVIEPMDPGTAALAAHYALDGTVVDSSGNGYDGASADAPFFEDAPGDLGQAMFFDGIDDHIDLPITALLSSLSDMTIATWVNFPDEGGSWQRIFDFGSGTDSYIMLTPRQGTSGPMTVAVKSLPVPEKRFVAPDTLASGWHHVAVVVDSATMNLDLYLDGAVIASDSTPLLPKDLDETTQNWLGRSQWEADAYYSGLIGDFRIYGRALSAGEVRYLAGDR